MHKHMYTHTHKPAYVSMHTVILIIGKMFF